MTITFWRINGNFDIRITVGKLSECSERKEHFEPEHGTFYYKTCTDEEGNVFYSFGLDGKQQWWSSNADSINKRFGLDIIECSTRETEDGNSWMAGYGIARADIKLPECLMWDMEEWGWWQIIAKPGYEFPSGDDYFRSTLLDEYGNLVYPKGIQAGINR